MVIMGGVMVTMVVLLVVATGPRISADTSSLLLPVANAANTAAAFSIPSSLSYTRNRQTSWSRIGATSQMKAFTSNSASGQVGDMFGRRCTPALFMSRGGRRRGDYDDVNDEFNYGEDDDEGYYDDDEPRRRRRRKAAPTYDDLDGNGGGRNDGGLDLPSPFGKRQGIRLPDSVSKALLAGVFVLGIGMGVTVDSAINTNPKDLASRDAVDRNAPNARLCTSYGASAMAFDQRVFVSFDPFNVYVAQADVKPACVLRSSNVVPVLRDRGLVNDKEVSQCKSKMNTWAFVGDLDDIPQLSCVYESADAQNEFLSDPKLGIGEDVWDDERAKGLLKSTGKLVKGGGGSGGSKAAQQAERKNELGAMSNKASGMWSL